MRRKTAIRCNDPILTHLFEIADRRRLTQDELAARIGVTRMAVYYWRRGAKTPSTFLLGCFANAVDYDLRLSLEPRVAPAIANYSA